MLEAGQRDAAGSPAASGGFTGGGFTGSPSADGGFTGGGFTAGGFTGTDFTGTEASRASGSNGLAGPASGGFDFSAAAGRVVSGEDAGLPGASSTDGRRAADSGTGWDHLRADPPARHAPARA